MWVENGHKPFLLFFRLHVPIRIFRRGGSKNAGSLSKDAYVMYLVEICNDVRIGVFI
jgi:hypothetical protein